MFFSDNSDQRNIMSDQSHKKQKRHNLFYGLNDYDHIRKGGESHPLVAAIESAVLLIPAVTLALLLKDEEEESSA